MHLSHVHVHGLLLPHELVDHRRNRVDLGIPDRRVHVRNQSIEPRGGGLHLGHHLLVHLHGFRRTFAGLRWGYFGSRALVGDNSVRSRPTSLVNLQAGRQLSKNLRVTTDVFNLFDAKNSDIEYYFASRLPGEPLQGVADIHFHPVVPRTMRVSMIVGF